MSRQPNMRDGELRQSPYGPDNAPPPPVAPPPEAYDGHKEDQHLQRRSRPGRATRQRTYAQAEAEHLREREQERMRSRSPVRPQYRRDEWPRYRERSPIHREQMNMPPRRDDRRRDADEGTRCFACNEPGHRAADCGIAQHFGRKACFRCGDTGHIARACKVRGRQIKTEVSVVAGKSDRDFNRNYDNERGDDRGWCPSQGATTDGHVFTDTCESQERSSGMPSRAGYYVEDEVDWGEDDDNEGPEDQYEKPQHPYINPQRESNWNPDRLKMVQEPYLGLPHLKNARFDDVPPTVQDLRGYDYRIKVMYESKPKNQRFVNGGNGKIAPALYGSEQRHDLGLCFATFLTRKRCEMRMNCPWRHHPLSNAEKAWIIEYGKKRGKEFIDNVDRWWSFPEVPLPGATMHGLGDKDT